MLTSKKHLARIHLCPVSPQDDCERCLRMGKYAKTIKPYVKSLNPESLQKNEHKLVGIQVMKWVAEETSLYWDVLRGLRQLNAVMDPKSIDNKAILGLSRHDIRLFFSLMSEQCLLDYHLFKIISESEIFLFCKECRETTIDIICDCEAIAQIRWRHLHRAFLKPLMWDFYSYWYFEVYQNPQDNLGVLDFRVVTIYPQGHG
ncbi:hypothetical protein J6590_073764 [Homalodisca vitripennis]|nr:hypothetical protein J6590_073764 [Homalodisca vitripennis]